jgi:hypothetical protein
MLFVAPAVTKSDSTINVKIIDPNALVLRFN